MTAVGVDFPEDHADPKADTFIPRVATALQAGAPSAWASVNNQCCAGAFDSTPAGAGSHLAEKNRTHQVERSAARP